MRLFPRWAALAVAVLLPSAASACPFCTAQALTLTEEVNAAQVAVVATLAKVPDSAGQPLDPDTPLEPCHFTIDTVIKGDELLGEDRKAGIKTLYLGQAAAGTKFFLTAFVNEQKKLAWGAPIALPERGPEYLSKILKLPAKGRERVAFFQDYLQDKEDLLSRDAYDEFAKTAYDDLKAAKDVLRREEIIAAIKHPETKVTFRRLYLSLLSICGKADDVPMLEELIKSEDRRDRSSLDSMLNCYMALHGEKAMPLIEDLFLKDPKVDYVDRYSAIMAIRFQGTEGKAVPMPALIRALKHNLDHPKVADLVVMDLARWQDWDSMERLVEMFKKSNEETIFIREPVINFLRICPRPEAKAHLEELAKLDPIAYQRALSIFQLPPQGTAKKPDDAKTPATATAPATTPTVKPEQSDKPNTSTAPAPKPAEKPIATPASVNISPINPKVAPPAPPVAAHVLPTSDHNVPKGTLGVAVTVVLASVVGAVYIVRKNPGR